MNPHKVTINVMAASEPLAIVKAKLAEKIASHGSEDALKKIAELIEKPNASEKFLKALNNAFIKALF